MTKIGFINSHKSNRKSFTLIEILLVSLVLVLISVAVISTFSSDPHTDYEEAKIDLVTQIKAAHYNSIIDGDTNFFVFDTNSPLVFDLPEFDIVFYPDGAVSPCEFLISDKTGTYSNKVQISEFGTINILSLDFSQ